MAGQSSSSAVLSALSSFIIEQEEWLKNWLSTLGWTKSSLQDLISPALIQCSVNADHYIPSTSVEDHERKCRYASALGVNMEAVDWDEVSTLNPDNSNFLYKNSAVESVQIGPPTEEAVRRLAANFPESEKVSRSRDSRVLYEQFSSLEDVQPSPQELMRAQDLPRLISYIKAWKKVPSDCTQLDNTSVNQGKVKGWLFKNLPESHAHSAALGGEMTMVDSIMACLTPSLAAQSRGKRMNLTPNVLMSKLQPLLGINARSLVLSLWKYLHISKLQKEHGMSDSFVSEIAPMPQAVVEEMRRAEGRREGEDNQGRESTQSIAKLITELKRSDDLAADAVPPPTLPPDHVTHCFNTSERRILYDYVVEVTSRQALLKLDPDLYRDDMAVLKAKLKAEAKVEASSSKEAEEKEVDVTGKTYLQLLKEKRDYKRRRQKYRAKNVHITRRTPTEIFRTVINNRMEELRASLADEAGGDEVQGKQPGSESHDEREAGLVTKSSGGTSRTGEHEEDRSRRRERSRSLEREKRGERKRERRQRSRSRSRERRRRSRSRGKRKRSRSRSNSRDRSRRRSRSRERHKKHKKHKKRSKSR